MRDETIPAEVMLAAVRALGEPDVRVPRSVHKDTSIRVAEAILAERERCAKIAGDKAEECRLISMMDSARPMQRRASSAHAFVAGQIASSIRSSHE